MTSKKNNSSLPFSPLWIWVLVWLPFLLLFLIAYLTSKDVFGKLPSVEELQNPKSNIATVILSSDGKILGKYYAENRINVEYKNLSPWTIKALLATEDIRFNEHSGIDIKALFRSAFGVFTGSSKGGGSTLTQQLAKMMFPREKLSKPQLILRKIKEWIIAIRLEKNYTKEEIMTMYLNRFDFLNLAVGIHSAAKIYFSTVPDSLNIQQSAMLVGMAQNPSLYNPIRFPERCLKRRNVVLSQMKKYKFITPSMYDSLVKLTLGLKFSPESHNEGLATYFREYLREFFLKDWCKNHINPETGEAYNLYKDGLKIYTTIDSRMQLYAEQAVQEHMHDLQIAFFKECKTKRNAPFAWNLTKQEIEQIMLTSARRSDRYRGLKNQGWKEEDILKTFHEKVPMRVYTLNGEKDTIMTPWDSIRYYKSFLQCGFMAMEPQTGFIKAWVGGINYKHFKYDHVKLSKRQVGSTFKPFVYALAIQEGYSPCYQVPNVRTCITDDLGREWCPDNSDGEKGTGKLVTLRYALANSINYISAWLMKQFGPHAVVQLARRLGITSDLPEVPSLCLGTADISLYEMVGANSTFANKGTYIEPIFVTRIEDKNGKVLEQFTPKMNEVFSEDKAYIMIQLMKGVVDYGTGVRLRYKYNLRNPIAGKTGTTQNNSDGWFIGLTPELAAGAWVGGDERSIHFNTLEMGQGATMALPIWAKFFQKVYADKSLKVSQGDFPKPANLGNIELDCSKYDKNAEQNIDTKSKDWFE
ncbi:MAG TPA: transglycosylase domain-containing protein [Bacteroidia bacterium]|nr:transglycosylase domain-containing protein [Bacteroidia bacterium]